MTYPKEEWIGEEGHPGEPGLPGIGEGGAGGHGGRGGRGGNVSMDFVAELAVITQRVNYHEESCAFSRKLMFWIVGGLATVIAALFGQILLISGRQEVVLAALTEHTTRMNAITTSMTSRDEAMRADLKDIQRLMQQHVISGK